MRECNYDFHCTPFEQDCDEDDSMIYFIVDFDECSYGSGWKEFSWNKYTENILDYGEEEESVEDLEYYW